MLNVRFAGLVVLGVALAACDAAPKDVIGPTLGPPMLSAAGADEGTPLAVDENMSATDDAGIQQILTGGKASGHADVDLSPTVNHRYSFNAQSTDPPPLFAAKGNVVFHITFPGGQSVGKGDVVCMSIIGNIAHVAAVWTDFRINNVVTPIPPGQNLIWTVQDNGEGSNDPPDLVSLMFQTSTGGGQVHCTVGRPLPLLPNNNGNVQVKPE
jgi:hypothetical protein